MNKNVSIVVVILVLVVIAGYLVWIRSRVQSPVSPVETVEETMVESPIPAASNSAQVATPAGREATSSMKEKTSTSSSTKK